MRLVSVPVKNTRLQSMSRSNTHQRGSHSRRPLGPHKDKREESHPIRLSPSVIIMITAASVWWSVAVLLWSTNPTVAAAWSFQRHGDIGATVGRRGGQRYKESTAMVRALSGGGRPGTTALSSASSSSTETPQPWITPALHNSNAVRSLALLVAVGATGLLTKTTATTTTTTLLSLPSAQIAVAIHLFSFATSFGTNLYTTFVLGLTMIKHLTRQTFGKLQAKLFPKYFALSSLTLVLQVTCNKIRSFVVARRSSSWFIFVIGFFTFLRQIMTLYLFLPTARDAQVCQERRQWQPGRPGSRRGLGHDGCESICIGTVVDRQHDATVRTRRCWSK
jgi:hypothetical protein